MGLPLWRDPPAVVQSKRTVKADPTAPARSSIRRQPTIRHRDNSTPDHLNPASAVARRTYLNLLRRDHQSTRRDGELSRRDREQPTTTFIGDDRVSDDLLARLDMQEEALNNGRLLTAGTLRDGMPPIVPVAPETAENSHGVPSTLGDVDGRMSPAAQYMLTPPYLSADADTGSLPATLLAPARASNSPTLAPRTSSLTPRFAPAYYSPENPPSGFDVAEARARYEGTRPLRRYHRRLMDSPAAVPGGRHNNYPNERRSQLSRYRARRDRPNDGVPAAMAITPSDGLGDRRRSFSPEEDTWETLLTTITPDERLPSASSSFTSASASASASSVPSNSSNLSATLRTAPSSTSQTLYSVSNICDDLTDSDYSDFDTRTDYLDFLSRVPHENSLRNLDDPPTPGPRRYPANSQARARRASQEMSEHFVRPRAGMTREMELEMNHRQLLQIEEMMDRLDRHESIPDEWWAAAGLGRSVGGRADRIDRERL